MSENIIELKNVSKSFPGVKALSDVNFCVKKGEVHSVAGENGAGKSTLIKILCGTYEPDNGATITIDGVDYPKLNPIQAVELGISTTFQDLSLFPNLTVMENIEVPDQLRSGKATVDWAKMQKHAQEIIDRFEVDIDPKAVLGSLSTAKQQMVAILRAIGHDARIVILDEPTSTLSHKEIKILYDIIRKLRKEGVSILLITHKLEEMFDLSDHITILRDGKYCGTYEPKNLDRDKLISLMVGRKLDNTGRDYSKQNKEVVLKVDHLTKAGNYKDISFELHKGEVLGISGLVGSGRTEMIESLFGITQPDSGTISINGKQVVLKSTADAIAHEIALVPENRLAEGLILRKTVKENSTIAMLRRLRNKFGLLKRKEQSDLALKWIKDLSVKPGIPGMQAALLSGGNAQRLVLAKWLMTKPQILMIDEPTNGIDVSAKAEIHKLLRELAAKGMSVIMVSSELAEILQVSDRIMVMKRGRVAGFVDAKGATQESVIGLSF